MRRRRLAAAAIALGLVLSGTALPARAVGPATFEVTVTAGGLPASARVRVWSGLPGGGVVANSLVAVDGTVSLPVPGDGDYYLEVLSQVADRANEFVPDTVLRANAQRFTIAGEQHVAVAVDLEQSASISGIITLPDGTPGDATLVGALPVGMPESEILQVWKCNRPLPGDAPGTYRIGCLHPSADWLVRGYGVDLADNAYYPNSQSAFNATAIPVDPGQAVAGIDFQLPPKSPSPTITRVDQQYFLTGTVTAGVHVFGTAFPADFHAIRLTADGSAFPVPAVDIAVTAVISPNELVATVTVQAGDVGATPIGKGLGIATSLGGASDSTTEIRLGDANTPVATMSGRVTDATGRSVANSLVAIRSTVPDAFGNIREVQTATAADGTWIAGGVAAGSYKVLFRGTPTFKSKWWPGVAAESDATVVTLVGGTVRTGFDAALVRDHRTRCSSSPTNARRRSCRSASSVGALSTPDSSPTSLPGTWARPWTTILSPGTSGWRR